MTFCAAFVLSNGLAAAVFFGYLESFLFRFPPSELPFPCLTFAVGEDVGEDTSCDGFNGVLRNVGFETVAIPANDRYNNFKKFFNPVCCRAKEECP